MCPYRRCRCDRQPFPRRRARVGDLCGFPDTAERVPAKYQKTGRCADVRECCGDAKHRKRAPASDFGRCGGEAGEKAWRFSAPARPCLPAVRAVLGGKNGAFLRG